MGVDKNCVILNFDFSLWSWDSDLFHGRLGLVAWVIGMGPHGEPCTKSDSFVRSLILFPFQWSPGNLEAGGQVSALRPGATGPGQGYHDLHAPDQIHVQQPGQ